ncbi:MAG: sigma-54-dependent Fis family transcriptional regulator [Pseudodesulfovibrio sp.]|nr:sigma-54-dependent Fis family transcriptional regulator [Pseudodesulfovibrio sp.]
MSRKLGLRGKLLLALLPSIVGILLVAGYASHRVSEEFVDIALARTAKMHTLAIVHEVEQYMKGCKADLLFFAHEDMRSESLRSALKNKLQSGGNSYFEMAYLPATGGKPVVLVQRNGKIHEISVTDYGRIQPNPLLELDRIKDLKKGEVLPSQVLEVTYPLPTEQASNLHIRTHVIRFYTYFPGNNDTPPGILFLSIQASQIRNILSLYNSELSPLWAFPRSDELRFSYLLDKTGWILFQSEDYEDKNKELTTFLARKDYYGTLGRQGQPAAFRPNENHTRYWKAFKEITNNRSGLEKIAENNSSGSSVKSFLFSYSPIKFQSTPSGDPLIYGGIVFVDRSQLPIIAGYKFFDVMLLVTVGSITLISILIFWFGRILTKPIRILATRMNDLTTLDALEEIDLPYSGFDIDMLQRAINNIIRRVKKQVVEIMAKDEAIFNVNKREQIPLTRELEILAEGELSLIPEIIGQGSVISSLKTSILKAAQANVDVLVSGETGTGKQLVAEAIHNHGNRKGQPFVSINCGALDENLLLDALFGHVQGAFSEAKTDRNGAFIEANGGTLFLDEIQSASPKVQQSLLRAIASRKIKPLGSDREQDVNVRIIAATNVDIPSLIEQKVFREDLYYRLKVISIATPALREHPENIPLLSIYYLKQAEQLAERNGLGLSKGALNKLISYRWPGNVRELVNNITRAAVMTETDVIQAEDIRLESDATSGNESSIAPVTPQSTTTDNDQNEIAKSIPEGKHNATVSEAYAHNDSLLNERQGTAWPQIRKTGTVTRKEYQEIVGDRLPTRTAIYDLQDFVRRGLLIKQGKGPSTRYEVTKKE